MSTTIPTPSQYSKVPFWDRIAEKYAKQPIEFPADYERKLEETRAHFRPDMRLLEFGCGTGSTALIHAPHVAHIRAIDVSSKMIEIAKAKAEKQQVENVAFEVSDFDSLGAEQDEFDMVLGLSILHLLRDRDAAIAEVYRILKPGGLFVSSTACIADTMNFFRYIAPIGRFFRVFPYLRVFSEQELVSSMTNAGFEIETHWRPSKKQGVFIMARKPTR